MNVIANADVNQLIELMKAELNRVKADLKDELDKVNADAEKLGHLYFVPLGQGCASHSCSSAANSYRCGALTASARIRPYLLCTNLGV